MCARLLRAREVRLQRCPTLDADFVVGVQATASDAAAVDRSSAETADIGDVGQEVRNESGLFRPNGGLVVDAGGEHRSCEIDRLAHVERVTVAEGPRADHGGEALAADRVVDHTDGIDTVDPGCDRHREAR